MLTTKIVDAIYLKLNFYLLGQFYFLRKFVHTIQGPRDYEIIIIIGDFIHHQETNVMKRYQYI